MDSFLPQLNKGTEHPFPDTQSTGIIACFFAQIPIRSEKSVKGCSHTINYLPNYYC